MFCATQAVTRAGLRKNEDTVWAQRGFLFVIDGATGLSGENYMDPVSDARWFAGTTAALHKQGLTQGAGRLMDILYEKQEQDRALLAVPRFKRRDDTSAVAAQIKGEKL